MVRATDDDLPSGRGAMHGERRGIQNQPLADIDWLPRGELKPNDYNPNRVAPTELELLKLSLLSDGWTQPIVIGEDGVIIDGYHRWLLAEDADIAAMTGGMVPVVTIRGSTGDRIAATIRHNRARGAHGVLAMAALVLRLTEEEHWTPEQIEVLLGMEDEERIRLIDRNTMKDKSAGKELDEAWVPSELP